MNPALLTALLLAAEPTPAAAPPANPPVRLEGKVVLPDLVVPGTNLRREWYPFLDERRDRGGKLEATLSKAVDVHYDRERRKDLKAQDAKNLAYERTWRARALKELRAADRTPTDERSLALFLWWDAIDKKVEPTEAIAALEAGAERFKGQWGYSYLKQQQALFLDMLGKKDRVQPLLEEALAGTSDKYTKTYLHLWLGDLAAARGDLAEQVRHYEAAAVEASSSDLLWVRYKRLWAHFRAGECERARSLIREMAGSREHVYDDWAGSATWGSMLPDVRGMLAACAPAPADEEEDLEVGDGRLEEVEGVAETRAELRKFYEAKTAAQAVVGALGECYVSLARPRPTEAVSVLVKAAGTLDDARFEATLAPGGKAPWALSGQLSTCAAGKLKAAPFDGELQGEVTLELPRPRH